MNNMGYNELRQVAVKASDFELGATPACRHSMRAMRCALSSMKIKPGG